jgi:cytochrome c2
MPFLACGRQETKQEHTQTSPDANKKTIKVNKNAVAKGKDIFEANCRSCHTAGKDDLVGPGMQGITQRREKKWILSFIRNSQSLIASGDAEALKVFNKYNKAVMTSFMFEVEEMENLYRYLESLN